MTKGRPKIRKYIPIGTRFGKLTIVHCYMAIVPNKNRNTGYRTLMRVQYRCDCGAVNEVDSTSLLNKGVRACPSCALNSIEYGKKLGRLTPLYRCPENSRLLWVRCDCSKEYKIYTSAFTRSKSKMCADCRKKKCLKQKTSKAKSSDR